MTPSDQVIVRLTDDRGGVAQRVRRLASVLVLTFATHILVLYALITYFGFPERFRGVTAEGVIGILVDTLRQSVWLAAVPAAVIFPLVAISTTFRLNTPSVVCVIYAGVFLGGVGLVELINEARPLISHLSFALFAAVGLGTLTGVAFSVDWLRLVEQVPEGFPLAPKTILKALDKSASEYVHRRVLFDIFLAVPWCAAFLGTVGLLKHYGFLQFPYVLFSLTAWTTAFLCVAPFALVVGHVFNNCIPWPMRRIAQECGTPFLNVERDGLAIPFTAEVRDWDLASLKQYEFLPKLMLYGRHLTRKVWSHLPSNVVYDEVAVDEQLFAADDRIIPRSARRLSISTGYPTRVSGRWASSSTYRFELREITDEDMRRFLYRTLLSPDFQLKAIALQDEVWIMLRRIGPDLEVIARDLGLTLHEQDGWWELQTMVEK